MESAYDLLSRLSDLRKDIYESARCITSMLETIEEERSSLFAVETTKDTAAKSKELKRKQKDNKDEVVRKKKKSGS